MSLPFDTSQIRGILFYKRDEITTDLACCDVEVEGAEGPQTWTNHEEAENWTDWLVEFARLPGFDDNWYSEVSKPPFAPSSTVAYERAAVEPTASKD